jgi:hypothetical protein
VSNLILRPRPAAAFCGYKYSTFNEARVKDPDFRALKAVPLGERAIGFFGDDLLRVLFRKAARRDGVAPNQLDEEIERRLIERRAQEALIAEAKARLETRARTERRKAGRLARVEA